VAYFEIIQIRKPGDPQTKKVFIEVELEEKNMLPSGYDTTACESKGFFRASEFKISRCAERQFI